MNIEAISFKFTYAGASSPALRDINLKFHPGEIVFVIGGNGSGKTTLLSCLAGLVPSIVAGEMDGRLVVDGIEIHRPDHPFPQVGLVIQEPDVYLFNTARDEICFPLQNAFLPETEIAARLDRFAGELGIAGLLDREMPGLSGGERQKVALCAALVADAPVLLLDEPIEQLDIDSGLGVLSFLKKLAGEGKTVIVASRSFTYSREFADRIVLMAKGAVIAVADTSREERYVSLLPECDHASLRLDAKSLSSRRELQPGQPVVQVENLTHLYKSGSGVKDISLEIARGETLAVMGPNGAGKTTLIKHLVGLLKPQQGRVVVLGMDTRFAPVWELGAHTGILFQNPDDQIFNERVDKEIAWSQKARGQSWGQALAEARLILEDIGLSEIAWRHPYSLSRSLRQIVALASVLINRPEALILDEPFKSLDMVNTKLLLSIIRARMEIQCIVLVTHDPYLALAYADRVALIVNGSLCGLGRAREVLTDRDLVTMAGLSPVACH